MTVSGIYEVQGPVAYRGFPPGTQFFATLDVAVEERAFARGNIRLVERLVPDLPESYALPEGWA
jgi:hypothetical protein